jgi:ParB-like nuclease domain
MDRGASSIHAHRDVDGRAFERHQRQIRHRADAARAGPPVPSRLTIRSITRSLVPYPPVIVVEEVPIDDLRPDPANPRRISDSELDSLDRSLRQFGFVQPVLARRDDRTVIGGHQRLVAARRLGLATVPVTWLDVSRWLRPKLEPAGRPTPLATPSR